MKKTYLAFASAAFLLAACGDTVENVNQMGMDVVDSVADLPKCTSSNEGEQALVKGEASVRVCVEGEWFATSSGDAGDFSCKTEELKDGSGLKIICNGDSIGVVLNGEKGDSGKDGKDGSDGKDADLPNDTLEADSEQVAVSLDSLAGYSQKGPFLKGSTVYLYELSDGRTLKQTNGNFTSIITRDDGRYKFTARDLVSQYAMIVVDGNYRNEVTGKPSEASIRLRAITDMRKRSDANINLLTHLEFDRVYYLVTREKKTVKQAKKQAQKEIFKAFHIEIDENADAEDLDVFGKTDADAALLAISVLLQGDGNATDLSILLTEISDDIAADGKWDGEKADSIRAEIADWAATADTAGRLDSVFNHVKGWGLGGGNVPDFKKFVRNFWYTENKLGACGDGGSLPGTVKEVSNKNSKRYYAENYTDIGTTDVRFICDSTSSLWRPATNIEKDTARWGVVNEGMVHVGQINRNLTYVFQADRWRLGTAMDSLLKKKDGSYDACLKEDVISESTYEGYYYRCNLSVDGAILGWVKTDDLFNDTYDSLSECKKDGRYGDGTLLEGRVNKGHFYACDSGAFRVANPAEVTGGLGCTSYNLDTLVILNNQDSYYRCERSMDGSVLEWVKTDEAFDDTYDSLSECRKGGRYGDGTLLEGRVNKGHFYVCDSGAFRLADKYGAELALQKGCTSYNRGLNDTLGAWRSSFTCTPNGWVFDSANVITDTDDGKTYKTIRIIADTDTMFWMAENLNKETEESKCYDDKEYNCNQYGRLYTLFDAACSETGTTDVARDECHSYLSNVVVDGIDDPRNAPRGVCPVGWHVPVKKEFYQLRDFVNINKETETTAAALKSTTGWYLTGLENNGNGADEFGFNVLPGGMFNHNYVENVTEFKDIRESAYILVYDYEGFYAHAFVINDGDVVVSDYSGYNAFSVRCVMDKDWITKIRQNQ